MPKGKPNKPKPKAEEQEEETNALLDKIAERIKKVGLASLLGEERA